MMRHLSVLWALASLSGCGRHTPSYPLSVIACQAPSGQDLCQGSAQLSPIGRERGEPRSFCLGTGCRLPLWTEDHRQWLLESLGSGLQGLLAPEAIQGHFVSELQLDLDAADKSPRGLILFPALRNPAGELLPDTASYVSLLRDRDSSGVVRYRARDRQPSPDGKDYSEQLLDNTQRLDSWEKEKRYQTILDGTFGAGYNSRNDFRNPFTADTGRLRIFHHSSSQSDDGDQPFFYLSYYAEMKQKAVHDEGRGSTALPAEGWMSLAPLAAWLQPDQEYFIGVVMDASEGGVKANFSKPETKLFPAAEPERDSDRFELRHEPYYWSGFQGDAWQLSFGRHFPASHRYRLVFWTEMNNVPAWHINDQLLFTYSFVELWPQNRSASPGCFEAMSDDMLWNNKVTILADHAARKIIHWRSYLVNPAYQTIAQSYGQPYDVTRSPESLAHADEIWTVYPDGTAFRHIIYSPDSQGLGANDFEIAELAVIAGAQTRPADHAQAGASLELWNPNSSESYHFRPSRGLDRSGKSFPKGYAPYDAWPTTAAVARLKDGDTEAPYIYAAFAQGGVPGLVSEPHELIYDVSWQGYEWEFSHWSVHREPYEYHDKTMAVWKGEVSHSSLMSVQVKSGGRSTNPKEFVSLVGIQGEAQAISARIQEWTRPPEISAVRSCKNLSYDPRRGTFNFMWNGVGCAFHVYSELREKQALPLALSLLGAPDELEIEINGRRLSAADFEIGFEMAEQGRTAIIYIPDAKTGDLEILIQQRQATETFGNN